MYLNNQIIGISGGSNNTCLFTVFHYLTEEEKYYESRKLNDVKLGLKTRNSAAEEVVVLKARVFGR